MKLQIRTLLMFSIISLCLTMQVQAATDKPVKNDRIEYLLREISVSNCTFIRNNSDHSSTEAEKHLRMKYNRTRSRIKTAVAFIDHLASQSSWTGKPYSIRCASSAAEPSRDWLYRKLEQYRKPE